MPGDNSDKSLLGELTMVRGTLGDALQFMNVEQLRALLERVSGTLRDLEQRWQGSPSEFQAGIIISYKKIHFQIEQQLEIGQGNESRARELRFTCAGCGLPFTPTGGVSVCTYCGSAELIEVDRIEPR